MCHPGITTFEFLHINYVHLNDQPHFEIKETNCKVKARGRGDYDLLKFGQ